MKKIIKHILSSLGYDLIHRQSYKFYIPPKHIEDEVANALTTEAVGGEAFSDQLKTITNGINNDKQDIRSKDLFSINGELLPCWLEEDNNIYDDWLNSADYYPLYYKTLKKLSQGNDNLKFLEIGVRTGYIGAVLCKAANTIKVTYIGIDPNIYIGDGLEKAQATFGKLKKEKNSFEYIILFGYSWDIKMQTTIKLTAPYDIIHIDGDHTLEGKLIDLYLASLVLKERGYVLVDDYDHHHIVKKAIDKALQCGWFSEIGYLKTKRGLAVLRK